MRAATADDVEALRAFLHRGRALVLTGAGVSTDSGIPDYRGPTAVPRAPMRYRTFVEDEAARRRYWARSAVGWPRTQAARPNDVHRALVSLERAGKLVLVVTQNVDRLHSRAGSRQVLELHGSLAAVVCLACGARSARSRLQRRLLAANPTFAPDAGALAPDGDVSLAAGAERNFAVPACERCGGPLKPNVVFFGENVPKVRVERAYQGLAHAEALLVLGSSLQVFSGYRFVKRARTLGLPVAIVNDGPTRGDGDADLRIEARLGAVLPAASAATLGAAVA